MHVYQSRRTTYVASLVRFAEDQSPIGSSVRPSAFTLLSEKL